MEHMEEISKEVAYNRSVVSLLSREQTKNLLQALQSLHIDGTRHTAADNREDQGNDSGGEAGPLRYKD